MSQMFNQSPSRRGTPSTQEPIPFFGSQREDAPGSTDFFSSIGSSQQQNADSRAYQTAGLGVYQQQQRSWAPSQPTVPYGQQQQQHNHQQQYTYNQNIPRQVPPRCATGPAQEQTYPGYGNSQYNGNIMAANIDPYRSASVVYGGVQYGVQHGYQPPSVDPTSTSSGPGGADFFAQLTGNSAPALQHNVSDSTYYTNQGDVSHMSNAVANQPEPLANDASGIADTETATYDSGVGVVYDDTSGQYYDTGSGQYYDNVTGVWYHPDQQASQPVADTHPVSSDTINQSNKDDAIDGAAFFDSLIDSQDQPFGQESLHNTTTIPVMTSTTAISERQVPNRYSAFSDTRNAQENAEQSRSPREFDITHADADVSQTKADTTEPSVVPETDLSHERTTSMPKGASPQAFNELHVLSDPATDADAASDVETTGNPIGTTLTDSGDVAPESNDTAELAAMQPSTVTKSTLILQNEPATVAALYTDVSNAPVATSQPLAGADEVSAFYSQSYSTVNNLTSAEDPKTIAMYTDAFGATAPLSMNDRTALGDTSLQGYGEDFDSAMCAGIGLDQQLGTGQQPSHGEYMRQVPIEAAQQQPVVSPGDNWGMYLEKPSSDANVNGQHAFSGSVEAVNDANHHTLYNDARGNNEPPLAMLHVADGGESFHLSEDTAYNTVGDNGGYGYTINDANTVGYTGSDANIGACQYSHHGDDETGDIQQQQHQQQQHQQQQHQQQRDAEYPSSSYMYPPPQYGGDHPSVTSAPLDSYANSSAIHPAAPPLLSSGSQPSYQGADGVTYDTMPRVAITQPGPGYESHDASTRPSIDMPYYGHDTSAPSQDNSIHDGIIDPLGRLNACYPVVAFGFGGKFASMFPKHVQRLNIYDSGKASRVAPGAVCLQRLAEHVSDQPDPQVFGGAPLVAGETTRSALLKRRDVAVSGGKAWLDTALAANILSQEEKVLFKVLLAILEAFDSDSQNLDLGQVLEPLRSLFCDVDRSLVDDSPASSQSLPEISNGSVEQIRNLEMLLLAGKREEAINAACSQGMWVHALIISSCTGKSQWQSVVSAYANGVLKDKFSSLTAQYQLFSGLGAQVFSDESQGSLADKKDQFIAAADIKFPAMQSVGQYSTKAVPETLARSDSPVQTNYANQNAATRDWAKTLSLILANRTSGDQGAILKLGDCLRGSGRVLAAHICYALTLQSKDIFLLDMPESTYPRAVLFGADEFDHSRSVRSNTFGLTRIPFSRFYRYTPALIATELYELAFALKTSSTSDPQTGGSTPSSGRPPAISGANNPYGTSVAQGPKPASMFCLPHFQAYKLQHAWWLVDCGQTALASRYCDAILGILATLPQGVAVPYIHSSLVQGLRDLRERLSGAGMTSIRAAEMAGDTAALTGANSKSWLARAMPRPSFASLMTVFDSSIDKFITGADGSRISLEPSGSIGKFEVGPDHHSFDYQSHGARQQHQPPHSPPRPLGAVSLGGRTPSPYLAAATATSSTFEQIGSTDAYIPSYGSPRQSMDGRPSNGEFNIHGGMGGVEPPRMFTPSNISSSYTDNAAAPGASQPFVQQIPPPQWGDPKNFGGSANGHGQFIDPTPSFGADPNAIANHISGMASSMPPIASEPVVAATPEENGDEEDIFGFSKRPSTQTPAPGSARQSTEVSRKSLSASVQSPAGANDDTADAGKKDSEPDDKAGSSVIGMLKSLWGGRKNQANLGEESNFVYDPELKRWVDKNAPDSQKDTGPPPPPPPSMMRFQPQSASVPPPSVPVGMGSRPGSVLPLHPSTDPSRTGTPTSTLGSNTSSIPPPPPASTGGIHGAKRRGARAKYVNVM